MSGYLLLRIFLGVMLVLSVISCYSQSTDQNFPTPVISNEVSGEIKARDLGDPRQTIYFYTFNGSQGDIFVNVVSKNFSGDIDIFVAEGLRPLSKIVIYADGTENETGRVIYLRKPEKLILRVEGRTPTDDPATFRLKFAGSFVAAIDTGEREPNLPDIKTSTESGIRVNSVGTIVERIAKPNPTPKSVEAETAVSTENKAADKSEEPAADKNASRNKVEVVVSENIPEAKKEPPKSVRSTAASRRRSETQRKTTAETPPKKVEPQNVSGSIPKAEKQAETSDEAAVEREKTNKNPVENNSNTSPEAAKPPVPRSSSRRTRSAKTSVPSKRSEPDPLEKIRLVIEFKDGTRIERPMSEVLRFTVDRGVLTVISRDGSIGRYQITDIQKTTIE